MTTPSTDRRILVVEDSATQAQQLRGILEAAGFGVVVATHGEGGLREFESGRFELVLSDVMMPGLSGYDLCRLIKAHPRGAGVPVILLTALEHPRDIVRGLACGADNFIRKPIDEVYLLHRVNRVLSLPEARRVVSAVDQPPILTSFMGEEIAIDCGREKILEFLLSTFADYVQASDRERQVKANESRQRAELDRSREREALFRSFLESSPEAMVIMDADAKVMLVNSRLEELSGHDRKDLVGGSANVLLSGGNWAQVLGGGTPTDASLPDGVALRGRRKDGGTFPAQINVSPIVTPGATLTAASIRDVSADLAARDTLRRQADELARSNADLEKFAYVASHDLQEPLRVVTGYMQLFQKRCAEKLDAEGNSIIERVLAASHRMKTLIEDLLAYSRVGTRGEPFVPTDCHRLAVEALEDLRVAADEAHATVVIDPLPTILGDVGQLRQLFQNLIGNAIKYRSQRPPEVHVGAQRSGKGWRISVRDNGIGIDRQYWDRIFVIFQRLHTVREYPGTGMGLAICKRIAERHGGNLSVDSVPGEGSTFHFDVPALPAGGEELGDGLRAA